MALLGAHVSVAGGAHTAFERGRELGCDALQIFVKNANRWTAKPLTEEAVAAFRAEHASGGLPVVAHAAYLINLASPKPDVLEKSRAALADELGRCEALGVAGLVLHPGAHLGEGTEAGVDMVARSLDAVMSGLDGSGSRVLLEDTAGQGSTLGSDPAELAAILGRVDDPRRLGVCIDSCHAFAAGADLRTVEGYEGLIGELERHGLMERVEALHLNDSKHPVGSGKDRHANIGEGEIGTAFFARVIHDPRFERIPMILETPLGDDDDGHRRDLATLRALA
jgi:deoxyribonuclease-4